MRSRGTTVGPLHRAAVLGLLFGWVGIGILCAAEEPEAVGQPPSDAEIGQTQIYATPEQALAELYPGTASIGRARLALSASETERLQAELGQPLGADTVEVLVPRAENGDLLGYALVDEEIGKYRPITFLVGTTAELQVVGVEVLVYRESRGGEVQRERFLRQYRGKTADDPIRISRDILNIAGATLSVRALNLGVRRSLLVLQALSERGALPE